MHRAAIPLKRVAYRQHCVRCRPGGWRLCRALTAGRNPATAAIAPGMRVWPRACSVPLVAGLPRFVPGKR